MKLCSRFIFLLLSRYHCESLIRVLIRALVLVDPYFTISSLKDAFDVLHELGLFIWRERGNVTPAQRAIRNKLVSSNRLVGIYSLFMMIE